MTNNKQSDELATKAKEALDNLPPEHKARGVSAGAGAAAGAVVGSLLGGPVGAGVGAAIGGAIGVAVGESRVNLTQSAVEEARVPHRPASRQRCSAEDQC